jgi:putative flippase GtrA
MAELRLPHRETQIRFLRFLVVGGTSFGVQVAAMKLALFAFETNAAFTLAFGCSTTTHYLLNRFWALPSARTDTWRQLRDYAGTAVISYLINFAIFHLCLDVFGLEKVWSTAIAIPPSTVVVFLILNYAVFRKKV